MQRKPKLITNKEDIDYILSLTNDISTTEMMELFGEFNNKRRCNPYDEIDIPPNSYGIADNKNTNTFRTTVGLWIFNKAFVEKDLFNLFYYIEDTIDGKRFKKIHQQLTYALIEDEIELEPFKKFLIMTQKFMPYINILSPSYTDKLLTCTKIIDKKKKELVKKYEKELASGDEIIVDKITKELLSFAKDYLKDDPSADIFNSGSRSSWDNHFKNMFLLKGSTVNPNTGKYETLLSNYADGVSKDEYSAFCNSLIAGPYGRAVKTQIGGYWEKMVLSAMQGVILNKAGSDCGTKRYLERMLTNDNINLYMYSYIIEGNTLVELTNKNKDKYIGKKVKFRFSSLCESKNGICNKCMGNLPYRLGIMNIGMICSILPSKLKNLNMKKFHNSNISLHTMDVMKAFSLNT